MLLLTVKLMYETNSRISYPLILNITEAYFTWTLHNWNEYFIHWRYLFQFIFLKNWWKIFLAHLTLSYGHTGISLTPIVSFTNIQSWSLENITSKSLEKLSSEGDWYSCIVFDLSDLAIYHHNAIVACSPRNKFSPF